jgi:hypothetical protein
MQCIVLRFIGTVLQLVVRGEQFVSLSIFVFRDAWKQTLASLKPDTYMSTDQ